MLNEFNNAHAALRQQDDELEARIRSHELTIRMQAEAPEAAAKPSFTEFRTAGR